MKARKQRNKAMTDNQRLAEHLRTVKYIDTDDQEGLHTIMAMLGGLELLRVSAEAAEAWGHLNRGLVSELVDHFDAVEAVLQKRRDGILYEPEPARATA